MPRSPLPPGPRAGRGGSSRRPRGGGATTQKGTQDDVGRALEDCTASRAASDLELALRAKRPESVLAAAFPPGTMLKDLGTMSPDELAAVVDQSHGALVQLLVGLGAQMTAVAAAEQAAQGSKFNAELKGGTLDDFYKGVTGICGPPSADIEKGMEEEHTQRDDSRDKFSTPNYGLQTDPSTEYHLAVSGGAECARAPGGAEGAVAVTGTRGCCKGGATQPDVRVLRPIEYYGDFDPDGRLKRGVGDEVVAGEALAMPVVAKEGCRVRATVTFTSNSKAAKEVPKGALGKVIQIDEDGDANIDFEGIGRVWVFKKKFGSLSGTVVAKDTEGTVLAFNDEGAAKIAFREPVSEEVWVPKDQLPKLVPRPSDSDTPMRRRVKAAGLWRCEVFALILYTGPMYVLLNAILRGFGFCGAVTAGTEFASDEYWAQWKSTDIAAWVKRSGHRFSNTCHALASAIKKLQRLADEPIGTRLYRGLGGLDVTEFLASRGFTDKAFMSTTQDLNTALHYSGVSQGVVGTVLCIMVSTTNNGAVIVDFSQYPAERETLWNACSHSQYKGEEEVALAPGGGVVKILHVLVSANSSAETVEDLLAKRKLTVTTMAANQRHAIAQIGRAHV